MPLWPSEKRPPGIPLVTLFYYDWCTSFSRWHAHAIIMSLGSPASRIASQINFCAPHTACLLASIFCCNRGLRSYLSVYLHHRGNIPSGYLVPDLQGICGTDRRGIQA